MTRKKILTIFTSFLVFPALLLILTGCGNNSQVGNRFPENGQPQNAERPGKMRMPDFGQPNRMPDIRGMVKSIVGNEVTILKLDMPAGEQNASSMPKEGESSNTNGTNSKNIISLTSGAGASGGRTRGTMMGGPDEQNTESRAQMLAKLKELSTGEEKVIIPVGIQMLKPSVDSETKKRTMVEATLSDVTSDKTITIWLNTTVTDKKVADFVLIN
jgi:hypothetical protein